MDLGKNPKNEFSLASKYSKLWNPLMFDESVDVKLLERMLKWESLVKLANKKGTLPLKLL